MKIVLYIVETVEYAASKIIVKQRKHPMNYNSILYERSLI